MFESLSAFVKEPLYSVKKKGRENYFLIDYSGFLKHDVWVTSTEVWKSLYFSPPPFYKCVTQENFFGKNVFCKNHMN